MTPLQSLMSPAAYRQMQVEKLKHKAANSRKAAPYPAYADNPIGFCRDILGDTFYPDLERLMQAVWEYPVVLAKSSNAVGKTFTAARIAIARYKTLSGSQVWTTAAPPEANLKRLLWGEIDAAITRSPAVFRHDTHQVLHLYRNSREFVTGVAIPMSGTPQEREAKFSGRHAENILFIVDEGDAVPAEVYKGIESCMSGGNARLLVLYNPRQKAGPVYDMEVSGRVKVVTLSALDHPNVVTGQTSIPGAVTRDKTVQRINEWCVPLDGNEETAGYGTFELPPYLVGATATGSGGELFPPLVDGWYKILQPEFYYMVLARYPELAAGAVYDVWLDDFDDAWAQGRPARGNVTLEAEYVPDGGDVLWAVDDGYAGAIDPNTGHYTPDSHPRVFLICQLRPDGRLCVFAESYAVKKLSDQHISEIMAAYPEPAFAAIDKAAAELNGRLNALGIYTRRPAALVEEGIKALRSWVGPDKNGWRRLLVHPRCRHMRYEMANYRRDDSTKKPKAEHDHSPSSARYLVWSLRYHE